jgi:hypothetical protein
LQPVAVQAAVAVGVGFAGAPPPASEDRPAWADMVDAMLSADVVEPEQVVRAQQILGRKGDGQEPVAFGGYSDFGESSSHIRVVDGNEPDDEADLLRMLDEHPETAE